MKIFKKHEEISCVFAFVWTRNSKTSECAGEEYQLVVLASGFQKLP